MLFFFLLLLLFFIGLGRTRIITGEVGFYFASSIIQVSREAEEV